MFSPIQKKIDVVEKKASTILFSTRSVFPFTLFPDIVIITEANVEIIFGLFFYSSERFPIPIAHLKTVTISTNLFFGSLSFEINGFEQNPPQVKYLPKAEAIKAKNILNGLILTSVPEVIQVKPVVSNSTDWETRQQLENIGQVGEQLVRKEAAK